MREVLEAPSIKEMGWNTCVSAQTLFLAHEEVTYFGSHIRYILSMQHHVGTACCLGAFFLHAGSVFPPYTLACFIRLKHNAGLAIGLSIFC